MKAAKTQKNLKEMPYTPQKELLKRKGNSTTPAQKDAPISQTSSEGLKLRNKNHLCQLVLIYVINLNQLFWKLTKEKFSLREFSFGGAARISTVFINNSTYHPLNPDADVTCQRINLFSSEKCFISFISDCPITFNEILLKFQSTNISLLHMYRVHLCLPKL